MPTHGSLSKAGKVRSQNPREKNKSKISPSPRIRNKKSYLKRVLLGRSVGQNKPGRRRRRR